MFFNKRCIYVSVILLVFALFNQVYANSNIPDEIDFNKVDWYSLPGSSFRNVFKELGFPSHVYAEFNDNGNGTVVFLYLDYGIKVYIDNNTNSIVKRVEIKEGRNENAKIAFKGLVVGDTKEKVIDTLKKPLSKYKVGDDEILEYPKEFMMLISGKTGQIEMFIFNFVALDMLKSKFK